MQTNIFSDEAMITPTSAFNDFMGTGVRIQTFEISGFGDSLSVLSAVGSVTLNRSGVYAVKVMVTLLSGDNWTNYNHELYTFTFDTFDRDDVLLLLDDGDLLSVLEDFFRDGPEALFVHNFKLMEV